MSLDKRGGLCTKFLYQVVLNSDAPEGSEWEMACSLILGKLGMRPPWPAGPDSATEWQLAQDLEVLRTAELMVISPSAHAAVMAEEATLETRRHQHDVPGPDIVTPTGLLVPLSLWCV